MSSHSKGVDRLELMRQARGIWKERDDLPDFEHLREAFDRISPAMAAVAAESLVR